MIKQDYACFELYEIGVIARWHATTEDGVIEVVPLEGEREFMMTGSGAASIEVHRTDDCLTVEAFETAVSGSEIPPYLLLRGEFTYEPSIEGCEPVAMYIEPPTCPEPVDSDG